MLDGIGGAEKRRRVETGGWPMQMNSSERLERHRNRQCPVVADSGIVFAAKEASAMFHAINDTFVSCDPDDAAAVAAANPKAILWKGRGHTKISIYGKEGIPHRDVVGFATYNAEGQHAVYRYGSGSKGVNWRPCAPTTKAPYDMNALPFASSLLDAIEASTGERPNTCVVTRYLSGDDSIGSHHDKVVDLIPGTGIHMISLGAARTFVVTQQDDRRFVERCETQHGQLMTLPWESNLVYKHAVRRERHALGTRISLIFRSMKTWFDPETKESYQRC